jgi:hypothetical protein
VIGTVKRTGTGRPSTLVTSYSHWRAAAVAASSKGGRLRTTSTAATLPDVSMVSARITMPRRPWASAAAGYCGCTNFERLGTGTSVPAARGSSDAGAACGNAGRAPARTERTSPSAGTVKLSFMDRV